MNRLQQWGIAWGVALIAIVVCYAAIDRPLALLLHAELAPFQDFFFYLTLIPTPFSLIAILILVALALRWMMGWPFSRPYAVAQLLAVSFFITVAAKDFFKFSFGRTWPETWFRDNPSFIRDGVYGFNPFHGGKGWAAFPSGHMAAICVTMTVLWICYPRLRAVYALMIAVVTIGLMGANYHFLSDVIAGGLLGASIGYFTLALWEARVYQRVRSEPARFRKRSKKGRRK
ncbi:MAG TPA: phosphatase PAP2 family protein [Xanthobacteraceae bacterium]|nr:phosphatase PAP2 family protein [Xanthobacteraceae bacterium]